jgi:hypothetical protein
MQGDGNVGQEPFDPDEFNKFLMSMDFSSWLNFLYPIEDGTAGHSSEGT